MWVPLQERNTNISLCEKKEISSKWQSSKMSFETYISHSHMSKLYHPFHNGLRLVYNLIPRSMEFLKKVFFPNFSALVTSSSILLVSNSPTHTHPPESMHPPAGQAGRESSQWLDSHPATHTTYYPWYTYWDFDDLVKKMHLGPSEVKDKVLQNIKFILTINSRLTVEDLIPGIDVGLYYCNQ